LGGLGGGNGKGGKRRRGRGGGGVGLPAEPDQGRKLETLEVTRRKERKDNRIEAFSGT